MQENSSAALDPVSQETGNARLAGLTTPHKFRSLIPENIPGELAARNQWVAEKIIPKPESGKPWASDKIPISPRTMRAARWKSGELFSFNEALQAWRKISKDGPTCVGFCFTKDDPYFGVDLDGCYDPQQNEFTPFAKSILDRLNTYSEISISNRGVKLIGKGKLPFRPPQREGIEFYDSDRLFALTGGRLGQYPADPQDRQVELTALFKELFPDTQPQGHVTAMHPRGWQDSALQGVNEGGRHKTALSLAGRWAQKGLSDAEILHNLVAWNQSNKPPKPELSDPTSKELQDVLAYVRGKVPLQDNTSFLQFPAEVMTGVAGEFAKIYGEHLEAPDHFFYFSFLCFMGLGVSDILYLNSQRQPRPRIYAVLLGESGDARKSSVIEEVQNFFEDTFDRNTFYICRGAASGEALGKMAMQRPKVLLVYDELKTFVSKSNVKDSTLLMAVSTLFESTKYENVTSRERVSIDNCHLALLAGCTTETYSAVFDRKYMAIGFNNRLWIIPGESQKRFPIPKCIDEKTVWDLRRSLQKVLQLIPNRGLNVTPTAEKLWHDFYLQIRDGTTFTKRLDVYGLRLMPLLAINEGKESVDEGIVEKVITLLQWQRAARELYDPIDSESTVGQMEETIRRAFKLKTRWSQRDLQRKVNYTKLGIWVWDRAMDNLKRNREIRYLAREGVFEWIG